MSGMTLRIALRQSLDDCVTFSDNAAKSHKVKPIEVNFSARKMMMNNDVFSAIEIFLRSIPASYPYLETITKKCVATDGLQNLKQEDVYSRQPIRRPTICLNTNKAFLGSKQFSTFQFRKVNLEQDCIYQKRIRVPDNPINTNAINSAINFYIRSFLTAQYLPTD